MHKLGVDRLSLHNAFQLGQAKWNGRDAAEGDANVVNNTPNHAAVKAAQRGNADL